MKDSFRYIFRPYELSRISLGILFGSLHRTVMCAMAVDRYRKLLENLETMNFLWNLAKMRNLHNIVSISMFQPMKLPTVQAK